MSDDLKLTYALLIDLRTKLSKLGIFPTVEVFYFSQVGRFVSNLSTYCPWTSKQFDIWMTSFKLIGALEGLESVGFAS